jgi:purine-binding chemotaxis protein CheW
MVQQIATFTLGNTFFGVNILLVKEVYRHMSISPIPDTAPHLGGLMNLRGRVVTVVDLNVCLNRPSKSDMEDGRLLIFKTRDETQKYIKKGLVKEIDLGEDIVGFIIDQMDDVLYVEEEEILPPPPHIVDVDIELIEGVVKYKNRLVILLDVSAILEKVMEAVVENEQENVVTS